MNQLLAILDQDNRNSWTLANLWLIVKMRQVTGRAIHDCLVLNEEDDE
jgi:hypothetical protein